MLLLLVLTLVVLLVASVSYYCGGRDPVVAGLILAALMIIGLVLYLRF